jgi:MoaA/NifB/PqqE/SkfB family radical SAM enzyme
MERLDLKMWFSCNNSCIFCVQGNKRERKEEASLPEIKSRLERGKKDGADAALFTGGEPTLKPDILIQAVRHAKQLGYRFIHIQSNGRAFSYIDFCRDLIDAGANEFGPAVHGSCPQIHDQLTRSPGSFNQTIQGIKNLAKLKQPILVNSVMVKDNINDTVNIAKLISPLGVRQIQFAFVHISDVVKNNPALIEKVVPRASDAAVSAQKGIDAATRAGTLAKVEAIPYCLMPGYEKHVTDQELPRTRVFDGKQYVKDFDSQRRNLGKAKAEKCKECRYFDICEGPWKEYPELFGWDEFKPVI